MLRLLKHFFIFLGIWPAPMPKVGDRYSNGVSTVEVTAAYSNNIYYRNVVNINGQFVVSDLFTWSERPTEFYLLYMVGKYKLINKEDND